MTGCGAEPADNSQLAADGAADASAQAPTDRTVRACELLDLAAASEVIGPGTEHPGGDTEELICMYSNAEVAALTLQLGGSELYEQITIMPPHMPVEIGNQGRYNVQENGTAAVQFAKGAYSVTISVQPIGTSEAMYLEPLLAAARDAADRLP